MMNEREWFWSGTPKSMLWLPKLREKDRKLRLLAVACCRSVWDSLTDETDRWAVEVAERFADGEATQQELNRAWDRTGGHIRNTVSVLSVRSAPGIASRKTQNHYILDVFGDPFQESRIDPSWRTDDVMGLAKTVYAERTMPSGILDAVRLGILADALEEAGCDDEALLSHCREGGPHVRGCWALDLILNKE